MSTEEIIQKTSGTYIIFGKNVIQAMAEESEYDLEELNHEIENTCNENNAKQLRKVMRKAQWIFTNLKSRYKERE